MSEDYIEQKQLGQIVTFEKGKPPALLSYYGLDAEHYLTPEYLRGRGLAESIKPSANAVRIKEGDTVVLWDGSNAGEIFKGRKGILASTMCRIKSNEIFNRDYFFYAVKNWEKFLKGQTSGSGIPHVDKEVLSKIKIIPFKKKEQAKIAEILSTVDRAIELTEAVIAKQQRIKAGLMQDLLSRGIDENGNIRSEQTHQFKNSPLGRIPFEWDVVLLGESQIDFIDGDRGENYPKQDDLLEDGYCLFLSAKNVTKYGFRFSEKQFITKEKDKKLGSGKLNKFDIIVTTRGTLGNFAFFDENVPYSKIRLNSGMIILRNRDPFFLNEYIYESFRNFIYDFTFRRIISGSAQPQLPSRDLKSFYLIKPTVKEQQMTISSIKKLNITFEKMESQLLKLQLIKIALMQDLLSGKNRVSALLKELEVVCV